MQKIYDEVGTLDKRCYDEFGLNEDILMEHAANGISQFIYQKFVKNSKIIVVCGSGNNGADGIALARLLHGDYDVHIFFAKEPKSPMAILQNTRAQAVGVKVTNKLNDCDVLVDAVVGTGFKGHFSSEINAVIETINRLKAYKIACDVPSGLRANGECDDNTFIADISLTMGALKKSMFSDGAKDFVGEIKVLDLGVARVVYEIPSKWNLLDFSDLELPYRDKKNTHKGSYGHLAIPCGDKRGASIMSGLSALNFGSALVTLVSFEEPYNMPCSLMHLQTRPSNATALACGMGLGVDFCSEELKKFLDNSLPMIADADVFSKDIVLEILNRENLVITPHPKEFVSLLKMTEIADVNIDKLQDNRFKYSEQFCKKYPNVTLLLKGANVIIAKGDEFFINPHGTSALAKGGSGDVLSGLVGALLAQGVTPLSAAINASLAHTKLAQNYNGADFSLTPQDLIDGIGNL